MSKETREKNEALAKLETYCRDFWKVLKRRLHRNNEPAELLTYYNLSLSGEIPGWVNPSEWLIIAQNIIVGDKKAGEKGYPQMQNPSTQELQVVLESAKKEVGDITAADRIYDEAQDSLKIERSAADDIINLLQAELRLTLRKESPSGQRRIMRTYGFTYKYAQGEPVEEEINESKEL